MNLYTQFAPYYHFHTPDDHYQANISHINFLIKKYTFKSVLDVGCGNGASLMNIFKEYGNHVTLCGFDISDEMIQAAQARQCNEILFFKDNMLEFKNVKGKFDFILSMSWAINYIQTQQELKEVFHHCYKHLNKGGILLLETAHAPNAKGKVIYEIIPAKDKTANSQDTFFFYRLTPLSHDTTHIAYNLVIPHQNIIMYEEHLLSMCNAYSIQIAMQEVGFKNIILMNEPKEYDSLPKSLHSYNILIQGEKL